MATKAPQLFRRSIDQDKMAKALTDPAPMAPQLGVVAGFSTVATTAGKPVYVVGETYEVPLFMMRNSQFNARVFYKADELDEMSVSLAEKGQDIPIKGYVNEDGIITVTDGQKRFQAATIKNRPSLRVLIDPTPASERDEYEQSRRINLERSSQTVLDDAIRWSAMVEKQMYASQDEMAEHLRISKSTLSKTINIKRIPERLLRGMSDNVKTCGISIAYEISTIFEKVPDLEAATVLAEEVIEAVVKGDLSRDQTIELIKVKLSPPVEPQKRERAESSVVKYGDIKGTLKVFPERGQLDLSFSGLPPEKVEPLKELIASMLHGQVNHPGL